MWILKKKQLPGYCGRTIRKNSFLSDMLVPLPLVARLQFFSLATSTTLWADLLHKLSF